MRYFLQLAYKGTAYHGWQVQQNAQSVQGVIQERLKQILQKEVVLVGSSRTDTGVHAQQQWAHVELDSSIDTDQLHYQLNATLPPDIAIHTICPVKSTAHARFDALSRTYEYLILQTKNPFLQETSYLLKRKLDIKAMNEAAAILCHKKDFESFSKLRSGDQHYVCTITEAQWIATGSQLVFRIQANRFVRGMVRSIVSNLLEIGLGKSSVSGFEALIDKRDRSLGASLVPACGLTLKQVTYPANIFINKNHLPRKSFLELSLSSFLYV